MRPASSRVITLWITVLCLLAFLFSLGELASAQTDTWTGKGANSDWGNAGNWNDGAIKNGENILINLTTAATDVNQSFTIGTLTLSNAGDSATILNGVTLAMVGNISNAGTISLANGATLNLAGSSVSTISNTGTIALNSSGSATELIVGNMGGGQSITLSGGGRLTMSNNANNVIVGDNTLFNQETISGAGQIGAPQLGYGSLTLVNSGTINANASAGMTIEAYGGVTNTGTIEATGGATLLLENMGPQTGNTGIINLGGTIAANASTLNLSGTTIIGGAVTLTGASTLQLGGTTIQGATVTNSATGIVEAVGGFTTLAGTLDNPAGGTINIGVAELTLEGNVNNGGTINIAAGGELMLESSISNTGTINMAGSTDTAELLVNGDITLSGAGRLTMSNNTNNAIIAVYPGGDTLTNQGTISGAGQIGAPAIGNGPLTLVNSGTINANASAGMTIECAGGLTNTGTIEATGGATLLLSGMGPQSGNTGIINLGGKIAANASTLSLSGTTITGGAVTLTGPSTLLMNNSTIQGANLTTSTTGIIEAVGGTSGLGNIIDASTVSFHNTGTLEANGGDMTIEGPGTTFFTNDNQTTGTLTGGVYIANGGNIQWAAGPNGIKTLSASVTEVNDYELFNTTTSSNMLTGLTSITATGALTLGEEEGIIDAGAFSNAGSLTLLSGASFTVGTLTQISGGSLTAGTYVLDANLNLSGASENITTNAATLTLAGGTIENANSTNALAGLASNTKSLTIAGAGNNVSTTAASFSNTGTLTIDAGDSFTVAKLTQITGAFPNQTLSGGTYLLSGNLNVISGTVNITTNSANLTLAGGTIIAQDPPIIGPSNVLAGLASNTKNLTIAGAGNNVSTTAASFSNTGTLTIDASDSFTAAKLTQSAGTTTVDGTLSATSASITGGKLQGAGSLQANVSIGGGGTTPTINVGDAGKAGLLSITGTYTQLSTGTMNVSIGGTTAGTLFSQLQVSGAASLAGNLTAALVNGFTPTVGQAFTVLTASRVTGTFTNTTIAINSSEHFAVSYTATSVVLTVASGAAGTPASNPVTAPVAIVDRRQNVGSGKPVALMTGLEHRIVAARPAKPIFVSGMAEPVSKLIAGSIRQAEDITKPHANPAMPVWNRVAERPTPVSVMAANNTIRPAAVSWRAENEARPIPVSSLGFSIQRKAAPIRMMPMHMPMMPTVR